MCYIHNIDFSMNRLTSGLQPPHTVECCFWEAFCIHVYACVCRVLVEGLHRRVSCGLWPVTANGRPCMAASISRPGRAFNCFGEDGNPAPRSISLHLPFTEQTLRCGFKEWTAMDRRWNWCIDKENGMNISKMQQHCPLNIDSDRH